MYLVRYTAVYTTTTSTTTTHTHKSMHAHNVWLFTKNIENRSNKITASMADRLLIFPLAYADLILLNPRNSWLMPALKRCHGIRQMPLLRVTSKDRKQGSPLAAGWGRHPARTRCWSPLTATEGSCWYAASQRASSSLCAASHQGGGTHAVPMRSACDSRAASHSVTGAAWPGSPDCLGAWCECACRKWSCAVGGSGLPHPQHPGGSSSLLSDLCSITQHPHTHKGLIHVSPPPQ